MDIPFTPEQERQLREAMGLQPEDELTPGGLVAFIEAAETVRDAWTSLRRDLGLET